MIGSEENIKLKYILKASMAEISKLKFKIGEKDSEIDELKSDIKKVVKENNLLNGKGGGNYRVVKGKLIDKNWHKKKL
mgnify:CR=1 FL=1